jgi:hypothetical protein
MGKYFGIIDGFRMTFQELRGLEIIVDISNGIVLFELGFVDFFSNKKDEQRQAY